jgi:hypothetical protein
MMKNTVLSLALIPFLVITQQCPFSEFEGLLENSNLSQSSNSGERAAADTRLAEQEYDDGKRGAETSILPDNIARGSKMDFGGIDRAIEVFPDDSFYRLRRAAMMLAAGQSVSDVNRVAGQARSLIEQNPTTWGSGKPLPDLIRSFPVRRSSPSYTRLQFRLVWRLCSIAT